ncbi:DUF4157 domain-containing protein [uncultured Bacteroides sp.]|uniref:eCIS core domain-containing protein n=1 Tax=uncultured Bacteroides sp. TaxID=162156 RepID=UPI0025DF7FE6|nr:DUF4157 domain-containing protein [uncultured Bacteroides sp.]
MNAERMNMDVAPTRVRQSKQTDGNIQLADNREFFAAQAKMTGIVQRAEDEDDLLQGKFVVQRDEEEEDDLLQGKFEQPLQRKVENNTGIPDDVKQRMEDSFGTDFSSVRVHPDSAKAPEVGALAYTQGTDIHFAPGQFKPDTSAGQQLLGHELTHVVQQAEGRVQPTTEIGGIPVNDNEGLEHEADVLGAKAAR